MSTPTLDPVLVAEHASVGALLLASDELRRAALDVMEGNDFTDLRCRFVTNVARSMVAQGVPVDAITLHAFVERHGLLADGQLRGSLALWLADRCTEAPIPAALPWYALGIVEQATRRQIGESGERIVTATGGPIDALQTVIAAEVATLTALSERLQAVGANV